MNRMRLTFCGAAISAAFVAIACGSSSSGDDSSSNNADGGGVDASTSDSDVILHDSGPGDAAPDSAVVCATNPCVVAIAAGGEHTCAQFADGTIRCWGDNRLGELGGGTLDGGIVTPSRVVTPTAAVGVSATAAISLGGIYDGENADYSCTLTTASSAGCWGSNYFESLGRGDAGDAAVQVDLNREPISFSGTVTQISAGAATACALDAVGDAYCWGLDGDGQVSATKPVSSTTHEPTPTLITTSAKFKQISAGVFQVCAVSTDEHVWCWGSPLQGETARSSTDGGASDFAPTEVVGLANVTQVASGFEATCALTSDGVAHCWGVAVALGRNDAGPSDPTPAPVAMPAGTKFTQIVSHVSGFCALDSTGAVWCWGANQFGEDGPADGGGEGGPPPAVLAPTKLSITDALQIAGSPGGEHICALVVGGIVKCWGDNQVEQLGVPLVDGGALFSATPVTVVF